MTIIQKKNISTLKLYNEVLFFKNLLKNNKFILFFLFQFFNSSEQLVLNKLLKKFNLKSKIISKKNCNYIFKDSNYKNLANICKNNLLIIYSEELDNKNQEAIKKLVKNNKLQLIASKINNNLYRPTDTINYSTLPASVQTESLITILQVLLKLRTNISFLKTL